MAATWSWLGGSDGNAASAPANWDLISSLGPPPDLPSIEDFVTINIGTVVVSDYTLGAAQVDFNGGSVTVTTGGTWDVANKLTMGTANLLIDGGGTVAVSFPEGTFSGLFDDVGGGTISVDGIGSSLSVNNGGQLALGIDGTSVLDVSSGGSVLVNNLLSLGGGTLGSGVVAVSDGSQVQETALALSNGSTVSVDATSTMLIGTGGSAVAGAVVVNNDDLNADGGTIAGSVVNDAPGVAAPPGQIVANGSMVVSGSLEITGNLSGTGLVNIENDGVLQVDGTVAPASGGVIFESTGFDQPYTTLMADETLILQTPRTGFAPELQLIAGAKIELGDGIQITGATLESNGLVLTGSTTYVLSDVSFSAPSVGHDTQFVTGTPIGFSTGLDTSTGDYFVQVGEVTPNSAVCFAHGTRIRTADGDVPVECLRVGQRVATMLDSEVSPIVWIGQRALDCRSHANQRTVWPVRIAAGVFGPGAPVRDLWLSPDHAVFFEDVLIPVKYLINGGSIAQIPRDHVTYFHVELVAMADGSGAEVIKVRVPGEPQGLIQHSPVKVTGLRAKPWVNKERGSAGVAYVADCIEADVTGRA